MGGKRATKWALIAVVCLVIALLASPTLDFLTVCLLWTLLFLMNLASDGLVRWLRRNSGNGR